MNQVVIAGSILCFVIGLIFCFFPIEKYRSTIGRPGGFGVFLVICGVVLMTTFKWTEVAIEFAGLKAQIKQAQMRAAELQTALDTSQRAFASLQASGDIENQKAVIEKIAGSVPPDAITTAKDLEGIFQKAIKDSNVVVLPASELQNLPRY